MVVAAATPDIPPDRHGRTALEFGVLGPLEVIRDGEPLPVPAHRQRALVTRLLLGRGQVVPATGLIAALWGSEPPDRASHALQVNVSRLRSLLGPAGGSLVTRPPGYLLTVPADAVDAERFGDGVRRAAGLPPDGAVALLDRVLAWWRGPAYAEFADTFAAAAAAGLEELRVTAWERRAEALLALGALERARAELADLAGRHPLRERPHALLIRALHLDGRQPDALEVYRRFRKRLNEELGLDPSPALAELHASVLRGELQASVPRSELQASVLRGEVGGATAATGQPAPTAGDRATGAAPPAPPRPALPSRPMTRFIGRQAELAMLARLIGEHRVVTLVGPGGVGKTRLAQELIAQQAAAGRAVAWTDLASTSEPADVPYRFVDALGLPEPADTRVEDFLVDALRAAPALVVADNCEHVVEPAADVLERIAGCCPDVVVVATSREPLGVSGERVLVVPPLPAPDPAHGSDDDTAPAMSLFADRYLAAGGPDLSDDDLRLVADLCRRVDGLPLAIELAAARARSLGIAAVTERPSLDLLSGRRRTGSARHRSLRAVLDWSHDLLGSTERMLFRRLAVFTGWFSLADAEAVCAGGGLPPPSVASALSDLVDRSMVTGPAARARYRLLDTMRAYAAEQLCAHGEDVRTAAAHAAHLAGFAEQAAAGMRGAEEPAWIDRITDRLEDLRAAFRWSCVHDTDLAMRLAAALATYARLQMRFEMQDWAVTAAELPGAASHPLRPTVFASAAAGAWARGDFAQAGELARQGLAAAADDDPLAAAPTMVLGDVALLEGRFSDASDAYERAVRLCGDRDPHVRCEAMGGLAITAAYRGDPAAARHHTARCLAATAGGPAGAAALATYFAGESRLATDPAGALELLEEARRLAHEINALQVVGFATLSIVSARARAAADPRDGLAAYREAIEHWRRVGNRAQQWLTLRNLVPVLVRAGHDELACLVDAAVRQAPVRMPDDLPEAEALSAAVGQARARLPDGGASADDHGARITLEELLTRVLAVLPANGPDAAASMGDQASGGDQAASSR